MAEFGPGPSASMALTKKILHNKMEREGKLQSVPSSNAYNEHDLIHWSYFWVRSESDLVKIQNLLA